jgi:hypothetical protein
MNLNKWPVITLLLFLISTMVFCQTDPRQSAEEQYLGNVINQLRSIVNQGLSQVMTRLDEIDALLDSGIVLAETLSRKKQEVDLTPVMNTPVYTVHKPTLNAIQQHWMEQLKDNIDYGAYGIYNENCDVIRQWLSSAQCTNIPLNWLEKRAQILRCFTDAKKVIVLFKKQSAQIENYVKEDILFADSFNTSASTNNYLFYGDGSLAVKGGRLEYLDPNAKPDCHFWTKDVYDGDFAISFEFQPLQPIEGGHIISYCGMPRSPGGDLSGSGTGTMGDYFNNITCYHYSLARGNSGVSNLRKCGPGLWMCANSWDPCQSRTKTHFVEAFKIKNNHIMFVDNVLLHHYVDANVYGDSLYNTGHIGIRNWTGLDAWYDNLVIQRLVPEDSTPVQYGKVLSQESILTVTPNPFNTKTKIAVSHQLSAVSKVQLSIFNISGKQLTKLTDDSRQMTAGIPWNASGYPAGIYIVRLLLGTRKVTKQLFHLK